MRCGRRFYRLVAQGDSLVTRSISSITSLQLLTLSEVGRNAYLIFEWLRPLGGCGGGMLKVTSLLISCGHSGYTGFDFKPNMRQRSICRTDVLVALVANIVRLPLNTGNLYSLLVLPFSSPFATTPATHSCLDLLLQSLHYNYHCQTLGEMRI